MEHGMQVRMYGMANDMSGFAHGAVRKAGHVPLTPQQHAHYSMQDRL